MTLQMMDANDGSRLREFVGHKGDRIAAAFTPDGSR